MTMPESDREIDLIRDMLLRVRAGGQEFTIAGYPERDVHQAAGELRERRYLLGASEWAPGAEYERVMPRRLTDKGEALAQAIESDWVWAQVKRWLPRPEDRCSLIAIQKMTEKIHQMRN